MGWLVDRLTPYKQTQPRWHDLAVALESYWDTYHTPAVERLEQMRSVFTAHAEDIEWLLEEAGVQFEVGIPILQDNRAFAYAWRSYEIHRKDNASVLGQVLSRDFSNLEVRWEPLYAPKNVPYGEGALLMRGEFDLVGANREDYYRTYRGVALTNLSGVYSVGHTPETFQGAVRRKIDALRPAHIVYEGEYFYTVFRALIELLSHGVGERDLIQHATFDLGVKRFDLDNVDGDRLDRPPFFIEGDRYLVARPIGALAMPDWGLDSGAIIDGDYWALRSIEGAPRSMFGVLGQHGKFLSRTSAALAPAAGPREYRRRGISSYWTLGRYPFDAIRADSERIDEWSGAPFPGWNLKDKRLYSAPAVAWTMPRWTLDNGSVISGEYWAFHGVEGDATRRVSARTARQSAVTGHAGADVLAGLSFTYSLPDVTSCYNSKRICADFSHKTVTDTGRVQPIKAVQRLTEGPAFDDLPGDLAPLDMHYEEAY